jgi:hypothetical protein
MPTRRNRPPNPDVTALVLPRSLRAALDAVGGHYRRSAIAREILIEGLERRGAWPPPQEADGLALNQSKAVA